jgi:hypothetical protein
VVRAGPADLAHEDVDTGLVCRAPDDVEERRPVDMARAGARQHQGARARSREDGRVEAAVGDEGPRQRRAVRRQARRVHDDEVEGRQVRPAVAEQREDVGSDEPVRSLVEAVQLEIPPSGGEHGSGDVH